MSALESVTLGQRVCVVGRGTANCVHFHGKVSKVNKTMFTVAYTQRGYPLTRRYRFDGHEVGASTYGGSYVATTCQRPKPPATTVDTPRVG